MSKKIQPVTSVASATAIIGQKVTEENCPEGCQTATCYCLCDEEGTCVACAHIADGEACVCFKDKDGSTKHVKLSALAALLNVTT